MDTSPELHLRHQSNLQSVRPLISCDLVSHQAGDPGMAFAYFGATIIGALLAVQAGVLLLRLPRVLLHRRKR